tara:strand:+ start:237 stop:452 length:216 start_codon:yes stop_codon:yes gene_type:complete
MILSKLILNQVVKVLNNTFSLDKIKSYVFNENELDIKVSNLEDRLKILESLAHSPKNFKCKYKDKKEIKYG